MFAQRSMFSAVANALSTKRILQMGSLAIGFLGSSCLYAFALDPPTITPGRGTYSTQQTVTMSAPAGTIYYTLNDGTQPTTGSTPYTGALTITTPTQINAVAYQGGVYSNVTSAYLDVDARYMPILPFNSTGSPLLPALRLRSDFGLITGSGSPAPVNQWIDLSGEPGSSVTHNSGNAPLLAAISAGRPAVRFTGASNLVVSNSRLSGAYTGTAIFVVTKPTSLTAGSRIFDFGQGASGNSMLFRISDTGSLGTYSTYSGTSPTSVTSAAALTQGRYHLLEASQAVNSPYTGTFSVNGIPGTSAAMNNPQVFRTSNFLGQATAGGSYYTGDVAEVLMYYSQINLDTSLTASQRSAIEAFLLQKHQILSQVPADPIISVPSSALLQPTQVVISMEPGAVTFITTDGTTPDFNSTPYLGTPLQIDFTQTVKAISIKNGVSSGVATATYTLDANQFLAPSPSDLTAPTINVDLPTPSL